MAPEIRVTALGLSPRVRGSRWCTGVRCVWRGSIPACAGEPERPVVRDRDAGVYPRVCGGAWSRISV